MCLKSIIGNIQAIPDTSLQKIQDISTTVQYPKGHILFEAGKYERDLYFVIKGIARNAVLERLVTPHYLRHSIATHLLEAGVPIEQVKDFLGHSHLEATQLYAKVYANQLRNL